ncbi:hypothetical protein KAU32_11870 [bacterium]|nr:hypothetical protein [bacterium]
MKQHTSALLQNPITMAEAIFIQYSRREERRIPTAVYKQRATQKTEKELQPEGNIIFGQFLPFSSLTDHRGYAALIVRWNCLKSNNSIVIVL